MTTTLIGVTAALRTALAAQITEGGVSCLPYDTWTRQMGSAAALSATTEREYAMFNGCAHLRTVRLGVLVYTLVAGDTRNSLALGEASVERVMEAIGADTTLGHYASGVEPNGPVSPTLYRDDNGQMLMMHEIPLSITVLPLAA